MKEQRIVELLRDACDGLRAQPARLLLAMLTMAAGVATLSILFALLAGLDRRADQLVAAFGADVIAITPLASAGSARLPDAARDLLRANLPRARVSAIRRHAAIPLDASGTIDVLATDAELPAVRGWPVIAGRPFDAADERLGLRVCLLSRALADERRLGPHDAISLAGLPLRIVGVVSPAGADGLPVDPRLAPGERFLLVPERVPPYWLRTPAAPAPGVDALFIKTGAPATVAPVLAQARQLLQGLSPRVPPCTWTTADSLITGIRTLRRTLRLSVGAVAMLCLLLGGSTLSGLMLARVQARIPEIGLRRSLGASRADIASLFIAEALVVSAGAAVVGLLAPLGALALLPPGAVPLTLSWNVTALTAPTLVVSATAVLATLWPALAAARIAPHEALRND